jgi:cleavage and polyadenylation specificity factor subunit 1
LRLVFERLRQYGLVINQEKCVFAVSSFEFLGHLVSAQGARPLHSYVEAVERRPRPTNTKELQVFLGLVNFYRRFLPDAAAFLKPLTDSLRGSKSSQEAVTWSPELEASFEAAKRALSRATWLEHPDPSAALALHVDASASHVGAALHQRARGRSAWRPLGFFSKKLDEAQTRWSAFDRELFACVEGIRHFRYILEGRAFTIFTDHKPLVGALARASDPWTPRQCRHLAYIAEFTSDVQHVAGQDNLVADALSRPPVAVLVPPTPSLRSTAASDLEGLASRQRACAETQQAQS